MGTRPGARKALTTLGGRRDDLTFAGASGAALQLVVGGYLIALAMMLITGARLGQVFGYRRAFVAASAPAVRPAPASAPAPDKAEAEVAAL
jgi:hypothetical protein